MDKEAADAPKLTLDSIPDKKVLPDGSKLLAEASAYLLLERGVAATCGGFVEPHPIQLLRLPTTATPQAGMRTFKLVVLPREGDEAGKAHEVLLNKGVRITPALKQIRRQHTHFIKPHGESLAKAIAKSDGQEIRLFTFEVRHSSGGFAFWRQKAVRLGFTSLEEALGWYVYVATCASIMDQTDPDFRKVIGRHVTLADHAAATRAVMLDMDDTPSSSAAGPQQQFAAAN